MGKVLRTLENPTNLHTVTGYNSKFNNLKHNINHFNNKNKWISNNNDTIKSTITSTTTITARAKQSLS